LDQAFLMPLPKSCGARRVFEIEPCYHSQSSASSARINRLEKNKSLWPSLVCELRETPHSVEWLSQFAETDKGQSLLHLAVLDDQLECISLLAKDRCLLERRNQFGLTPLELALYLHKPKSYDALTGSLMNRDFLSQPRVEIQKERPIDVEYLSQPVFESQGALEEVLSYTQRAKTDEIISHDRIWMGVYFDKEIQWGLHPRIAVQRVNEEIGYGVFASERILSCAFLGEYTGLIVERKRKHARESKYCVRYTCWPLGKRAYVIDAEKMGNFTRFINHSDQPNAGLVCVYWRGLPRLIFVSLKEIAEGSQITFDYGRIFWKQSPDLSKRGL